MKVSQFCFPTIAVGKSAEIIYKKKEKKNYFLSKQVLKSNNAFVSDGGLKSKYNKNYTTLKKNSLNYNKKNSNINSKNSNKKLSINIINKESNNDNNEQKEKEEKKDNNEIKE